VTPSNNQYEHNQPSGLARLQANALKPMACPRCGSEWLSELNLRQYQAHAYSAMPGGDISYIGESYHTLRFCPCGFLIAPNIGGARAGRQTNQELASLRLALEAVTAYHKSQEPVTLTVQEGTSPLLPGVPSTEVVSLQATVSDLEGIVANLTMRLEELVLKYEDLATQPAKGK